jgi:hypothetical protein
MPITYVYIGAYSSFKNALKINRLGILLSSGVSGWYLLGIANLPFLHLKKETSLVVALGRYGRVDREDAQKAQVRPSWDSNPALPHKRRRGYFTHLSQKSFKIEGGRSAER